MKKLIHELRRRGVFRVAGLYIGLAWIVIEAADVILPVFDPPEWAFRSVVIVAFIGFPVAVVLAWLFEVTERGIELDETATERAHPPLLQPRQMDFIVIGVLVVALTFSVYLNLQVEPTPPGEIEPISVLVANFDNQTGDPLFSGSLEQALTIGIEGAPFVTSYQRPAAMSVAEEIKPGSQLDETVARLVSVREGVKVVLAGSVKPSGSGYFLTVRIIDPPEGVVIDEAKAEAGSKADVLTAVGTLSGKIRKALGDATADEDELRPAETFTAASLEAAHSYTVAQELARNGKDQEAIEYYRRAIEEDPDFGRAYSGWALSAFKLGHSEETEALWKKALPMMDRMTEREKYRTLGLYFSTVSRNYQKAIENYQTLVELYPADSAGHNNLAVTYFMTRDFERALQQGKKVLDIYPKSSLYRANYALYAMYAGDFETAAEQARLLIAQDETYHKAYLPLAMAALASSDPQGARAAYDDMARAGPRGASLAAMGLADAALYEGAYEEAERILLEGIEQDEASGNQRALAAKYSALAEARLAQGRIEPALEAAVRSLDIRPREAQMVPAVTVYLAADRAEEARNIAAGLEQQLRSESRAYARLIEGMLALHANETIGAVDALLAALTLDDMWLAHYYLGLVYLQAGHPAEALSEFETCRKRAGEVAAVFLDDSPTFRYLAPLPYWLARAQEEIGLTADARTNYESYLALRPDAARDPLAEDAGRRLEGL